MGTMPAGKWARGRLAALLFVSVLAISASASAATGNVTGAPAMIEFRNSYAGQLLIQVSGTNYYAQQSQPSSSCSVIGNSVDTGRTGIWDLALRNSFAICAKRSSSSL